MMKPSAEDMAIFEEAYNKYQAQRAAERADGEDVYINLKVFVNWLTEQYGASRGVIAGTIFDILKYVQQMEKVTL